MTNNLSQMDVLRRILIDMRDTNHACSGFNVQQVDDWYRSRAIDALAALTRTPPPADDVVEAVARGVDFSGVFTEARFRFVNDATQPIDFNEHLVRVAAEHAARAALSAMPASTELVEAARPFAEFIAREKGKLLPDDLPLTRGSPMARDQLLVSDFRRLAAALRNAEQPEEKFDCGNLGWCRAEGRCTRHAHPAPEPQP